MAATSSSLRTIRGDTPSMSAVSSMIWSKSTLSIVEGETWNTIDARCRKLSSPPNATCFCACASTEMYSVFSVTPCNDSGGGGINPARSMIPNKRSIRRFRNSLFRRSSTGPSISSFSSWRSSISRAVIWRRSLFASIRNRSANMNRLIRSRSCCSSSSSGVRIVEFGSCAGVIPGRCPPACE